MIAARFMARAGLAAALCLLPAVARAADARTPGASSWQDEAGNVRAGELDVPLNKSQMLRVDQPYGRIMLGNEDIADVVPITSNSIYVLGRKFGTTSLTVYDKSDRVLAVVDVAVGPDVVSLRRQLAELIPGQKIDAHISNASVVLTGVTSNAVDVDRAVQLAKTYAAGNVVNMLTVGASQQVMLEVRFAEVRRDAAKQLGIGAFARSGSGKFDAVFGNGSQLVPATSSGGAATGGPGVLQRSAVTDTFGVFRQVFKVGGVDIEGTLDALETKGLIKTLAQPTLIALSGQTASFLAGGEFPIPVVQNSSGTGTTAQVTVQFKPFGVSLAFTPTVLAGNVISLSVEPEVSALDASAAVQVNGLTIPGLRTRRASTVLELRDGEAFAVAGLLQKDFATTVRQLPVLGSLPVIGTLFRSSGFDKGDTELVIVVIPHLVQPVKPEQLSLPTDRVQDPREGDLFLNGRTDGAVSGGPFGRKPEPAKDGAKDGKTDYEY